MSIKDLIDKAEALPVEERALVVDSLLRSLNPPEARIDEKWASVARERLKHVRSGKVEAVPGQEVFEKIWGERSR
ncbi:addiction module protein [Halomonas lysinitropha]|uniref:Addiction module component n=1 Tax=Halomonas lysinitropha TaxID=2607506 RepID=A0A5K1I796_9GAMM|nr:addiction module protein [Halomonas lysinitropha]VVZ96331.1 Putative addiction module component [Halomonas lysinitropha]